MVDKIKKLKRRMELREKEKRKKNVVIKKMEQSREKERSGKGII